MTDDPAQVERTAKADTYVVADPDKPLHEMTDDEVREVGRELFRAINERAAARARADSAEFAVKRTPEELEQAVAEFDEWQRNLDLDDPNVEFRLVPGLDAIRSARAAVVAAEENLAAAVAAAQAEGRSWPQIAVMLDMTSGDARERFGG